jgi:protein-S-isoprenylcysteine O-methyltransferase Ste14
MREGTGISLAIGGIVTGFFTMLATLIVAFTYLVVCVYGIVKLIGDADGHPDPTTIIVGFIALVSALLLGLLVGVRILGRSLSSRRREPTAASER